MTSESNEMAITLAKESVRTEVPGEDSSDIQHLVVPGLEANLCKSVAVTNTTEKTNAYESVCTPVPGTVGAMQQQNLQEFSYTTSNNDIFSVVEDGLFDLSDVGTLDWKFQGENSFTVPRSDCVTYQTSSSSCMQKPGDFGPSTSTNTWDCTRNQQDQPKTTVVFDGNNMMKVNEVTTGCYAGTVPHSYSGCHPAQNPTVGSSLVVTRDDNKTPTSSYQNSVHQNIQQNAWSCMREVANSTITGCVTGSANTHLEEIAIGNYQQGEVQVTSPWMNGNGSGDRQYSQSQTKRSYIACCYPYNYPLMDQTATSMINPNLAHVLPLNSYAPPYVTIPVTSDLFKPLIHQSIELSTKNNIERIYPSSTCIGSNQTPFRTNETCKTTESNEDNLNLPSEKSNSGLTAAVDDQWRDSKTKGFMMDSTAVRNSSAAGTEFATTPTPKSQSPVMSETQETHPLPEDFVSDSEDEDEKSRMRKCVVCLRRKPYTLDIYRKRKVEKGSKPDLVQAISNLIAPLEIIKSNLQGQPSKEGVCASCIDSLEKWQRFGCFVLSQRAAPYLTVKIKDINPDRENISRLKEIWEKSRHRYLTCRNLNDADWQIIYQNISFPGDRLNRLKKYVMSRERLKNFFCNLCHRYVNNGRKGFLKHVRTTHSQEPVTFPCDICGNFFPEHESSEPDYFAHWLSHFYSYLCHQCEEKFPNFTLLSKHRSKIHPDSNESVVNKPAQKDTSKVNRNLPQTALGKSTIGAISNQDISMKIDSYQATREVDSKDNQGSNFHVVNSQRSKLDAQSPQRKKGRNNKVSSSEMDELINHCIIAAAKDSKTENVGIEAQGNQVDLMKSKQTTENFEGGQVINTDTINASLSSKYDVVDVETDSRNIEATDPSGTKLDNIVSEKVTVVHQIFRVGTNKLEQIKPVDMTSQTSSVTPPMEHSNDGVKNQNMSGVQSVKAIENPEVPSFAEGVQSDRSIIVSSSADVVTHSCAVCDASFKTSRHRDTHTQKFHGGELGDGVNGLICEECGLCFKEKQYLEIHSSVHRNRMLTYQPCRYCGRRILNRKNGKFYKHMKNHIMNEYSHETIRNTSDQDEDHVGSNNLEKIQQLQLADEAKGRTKTNKSAPPMKRKYAQMMNSTEEAQLLNSISHSGQSFSNITSVTNKELVDLTEETEQ